MTNKINLRKSKKVSFNLVDALITLVIILYLAYIVYVHVLGHSLSNIGSEKVEIEYSIKIENVDPEYYSKIKVGDIARTSDGTKEFGVIVYISPMVQYRSLTVIIRSEAYTKGESFKVEDKKIGVGEELKLRFLNYAPSGKVTCTDIKVV